MIDIAQLTYTFRHSKRAKCISMRIVPDAGLEIILPIGVSQASGLQFLEQHRAWVSKHADMLSPESIKKEKARYRLVKELQLKCIAQKFHVRYLQTQNKTIQLRTPLPDVLLFVGKIKDARCCQAQLNLWLKRKGREYLIPMLAQLSAETGLIFNKVSIRLQRTRWGSCSAKGDISLNAYLLYLPYDIVHYVLIHELCHIKELNHSPKFWRLLASFVPNYRELRDQLKHMTH